MIWDPKTTVWPLKPQRFLPITQQLSYQHFSLLSALLEYTWSWWYFNTKCCYSTTILSKTVMNLNYFTENIKTPLLRPRNKPSYQYRNCHNECKTGIMEIYIPQKLAFTLKWCWGFAYSQKFLTFTLQIKSLLNNFQWIINSLLVAQWCHKALSDLVIDVKGDGLLPFRHQARTN